MSNHQMPEPVVWNDYAWNLLFTPRSLVALQQSGRLEEFAAKVTTQTLGLGLEPEMQIRLVRAAQQEQDPDCGVGFIRRKLETLPPEGRQILVMWAAAEYLKASFGLLEPAIEAALPVEDHTV